MSKSATKRCLHRIPPRVTPGHADEKGRVKTWQQWLRQQGEWQNLGVAKRGHGRPDIKPRGCNRGGKGVANEMPCSGEVVDRTKRSMEDGTLAEKLT